MRVARVMPSVFVGSSSEGLRIAQAALVLAVSRVHPPHAGTHILGDAFPCLGVIHAADDDSRFGRLGCPVPVEAVAKGVTDQPNGLR